MKPLESDPKRQAIPTLRGYSYQIWQSLLRWLELRENENLFLEGAEDIDILGPGGTAETVQIKETAESGSVTLRSADVLEAVNNFWEHQTKNPQIVIKFRFLTTSDRGQERPKEFEKMRGLDFWDSCKREGTDNQPLRDFLGKQKDQLSEKLREFINDASDDDLREKLLSRFEWDTGRKTQPFVEGVVRRKIVEYGDAAYALPPSESEKTISPLLQYVWEVVRRTENRWLTRGDFLTIFEEATTERIPAHELLKLKRTAANAESSKPAVSFPAGAAGGSVSFLNSPILESLSLPDLNGFAGREILVTELGKRLDESNLLVLIGSTGTGKSLLSYEIADATGSDWRRLDLRGFSPEQIRDRLNYAARVIEDETERIDCIVDDLNFDRQPHVYESALGRFLFAVKLRGGRVIFTSHHKPPQRIANYFDLPEENFFSVPPLGEADVKDLLVKYGCPEGHLLKAWTRLIHLQMRGNALLTHTRVRALASEGWRAPEGKDLTIAEEIKDVKGEFRRTLREQLPQDERTLLYRLSVFTGRFKRRHALEMGVCSPPISGTGDAFDALVGPWIEPIDATYFRLSPLLDGAAAEVFTEAQIKEMHRAAAEAFLDEVISITEFDGLLYHGLKAQSLQPLIAAAMSVFGAERPGWQEIAQFSGWFAYARFGENEKLFESDNLVNFLLRSVQFKIMAELDSEKAVTIAEKIEREIGKWDGNGSYSGTKDALTFAFLSEVIFEMEVPFTIKQVTRWLLQIVRNRQAGNLFFPEHPEHQAVLDEKLKFLATTMIFVRAVTARCREAAQVIELLTVLDESKDKAAREVWEAFKTDNFMSSTLAGAVWLAENRKETSNWTSCLETLDWIIETAGKHDATALAAAAYQAKAIVYKEYLHDADAAFKILEAGENSLGESEVFLQDYRAKIYFMEKNYAEAIKIWRQILPRIAADRNAARTFSFRDAEVCAARLGGWDEAAEIALRGEAAARLPFLDNQPPEIENNVVGEAIAVSYRADYAFAFWKMGKRAEVVTEFADILDAFKNLPNPADDFRVQMLYRRVGYAIGWFLQDIKDNDEFEEPPPGFFSNPETVDEVKDMQLQPIKSFWYLLARLEYKLRLGDAVFRRFAAQKSGDDNESGDIGYQDLCLRHALAKFEVENLVSQYLEFSEATKKFNVQNGTNEIWNEAEKLKSLTFTALLLFAGRGQSHLLPLADWRRDAAGDNINESFTDWLSLIEKFFTADNASLISALASETAAPEERILAALMISATADGIDVETRFYANVILLTADFSRDWRGETANVIEYWTLNEWKKIAERQRLALQAPNITAPAILAACADETYRGITKAANILLAARPAVKLKVNDSTLAQLRNLTRKT